MATSRLIDHPSPLTLRPPEQVMRLSRLGSLHQSRLSFLRCLLRRIAAERWQITRPLFEADRDGIGHAVYRAVTPNGACSLVAFSHRLRPEERSDRVIAERWDATFALTLGEPSDAAIERLRGNVPKQEAGRVSAREIVLSRANKSVRLFDYVTDCLAQGRQPALDRLVEVGYLMRTTAVYGNGKFGLSDLANTFGSGLFSRPFEAEMLTVYLIREFTFDLVEHCAAQRATASRAAILDAQSRRALGIGNATGLGMAPFLVAHPVLLHRWISARETAIARVAAAPRTTPEKQRDARRLARRLAAHVSEWTTQDARQAARIAQLGRDLAALSERLAALDDASLYPWRQLTDWAMRHAGVELQELLNSMLIELHGELVDDLADAMGDTEDQRLQPSMSLAELRTILETRYGWALAIDFTAPAAQHFFWYRSAEKEEPRLGERYNEPGAELELRHGIARDAQALWRELGMSAASLERTTVAAFLLRRPEWRAMVQRAQLLARYPYAEIRDNLLGADCLPIDMLRCKLALFGAAKFDPKSDRWTRITLYQGAPGVHELDPVSADGWAWPAFLEPIDKRETLAQ